MAQTRAVLTERQVIHDPYAAGMLTPSMRLITWLMRWPLVRRWSDSPFFAALGARISAFDTEVEAAMDAGVDQVVILGAGYDSRSWRLGRAGTRFFEVDHPATQHDKIGRAPAGGPTYVPVDLRAESLTDTLATAGFDWARRALFVVEGVTMYLERHEVARLLGILARAAAAGSRLAVNFAPPPGNERRRDRWRQQAIRRLGAVRGEPHRLLIGGDEQLAFVAETGWEVTAVHRLQELASSLPGAPHRRIDGIHPEASVISARR